MKISFVVQDSFGIKLTVEYFSLECLSIFSDRCFEIRLCVFIYVFFLELSGDVGFFFFFFCCRFAEHIRACALDNRAAGRG